MGDATRELEALRVADARPAVDTTAIATIDAVTESFTYSTWAMRERSDRVLTEQEWQNLRSRYGRRPSRRREAEGRRPVVKSATAICDARLPPSADMSGVAHLPIPEADGSAP
jgi:hypothetical protein